MIYIGVTVVAPPLQIWPIKTKKTVATRLATPLKISWRRPCKYGLLKQKRQRIRLVDVSTVFSRFVILTFKCGTNFARPSDAKGRSLGVALNQNYQAALHVVCWRSLCSVESRSHWPNWY